MGQIESDREISCYTARQVTVLSVTSPLVALADMALARPDLCFGSKRTQNYTVRTCQAQAACRRGSRTHR